MTLDPLNPHHFPKVADLRATLVALLGSELGTFPGGSPSIWVEDEDCPTAAGGVLAVITPFTNVTASQPLLNNGVMDSGEWLITIRSFGTKQQFRAAVEKMRRRFPMRRETILPYREGVRMQATFRVRDAHVLDARLY